MEWRHAFGGTVMRPWSCHRIDGDDVLLPGAPSHFPDNPHGTGFYLEECEEGPLPLLENPDDRLRAFDHWPKPRCFAPYPLEGARRAELIVEGERIRRSEIGRLSTRAAPELTFDSLEAGTPIVLGGMRPKGEPLAFSLPAPPFVGRLTVGPDEATVTPHLDAVDIDAEAAQVRLVYRAPFAYDLVRRERRELLVLPDGALEALPRG